MNVEQVSVISAIIGIAAVTICSMLTAIITQHWTRKTRQFELFFEARSSAYYNFLCACEKYSDIDDLTQIYSLYEASARALLFASPATQKWIVKYQESQTNQLRAKKTVVFLMGDLNWPK